MIISLQYLEQRLTSPLGDLSKLSAEEQFKIIKEKSGEGPSIISEESLLKRLEKSKKTNKPLRIKYGVDPTGPNMHIGHAIPLLVIRRFLKMGHKLILIVGDFTAMIGDPGERMDSRDPLTKEDVEKNMETYSKQISKVIDLKSDNVKLVYNSEWLDKLSMSRWLEITKKISVNSLIQREDFRKRLASGSTLTMAEMSYSLLMGYDSVELQPDVEISGLDQYLNVHFCRNMMENEGQKPEDFVCNNLLPGTTGEKDEQGRLCKMSKSRGNYVAILDTPEDMYGKVMSVSDDVMWIWYREVTEISNSELQELKEAVDQNKIHPKEVKQLLARIVVATFNNYDSKIVEFAENNFNSKFGKEIQLIPDNVVDVEFVKVEKLVDVLKRVSNRSSTDLRRLVDQKGLYVLRNKEYVNLTLEELLGSVEKFNDFYFKLGKRHYYHLVTK